MRFEYCLVVLRNTLTNIAAKRAKQSLLGWNIWLLEKYTDIEEELLAYQTDSDDEYDSEDMQIINDLVDKIKHLELSAGIANIANIANGGNYSAAGTQTVGEDGDEDLAEEVDTDDEW